jgi:hypothetical protein
MAEQEKPPEVQIKGVKIRAIGQQDKEYDLSSYMTVQELLDKYFDDMGITNSSGLLLFDGRVMKKDFSLCNFRLDDELVIQAMIIPDKEV